MPRMPKKLIAARSVSRWPEPASPARPANGRTRSRDANLTSAVGQVSGPSNPPAMAPPNRASRIIMNSPLDLLGEFVQPPSVVVRTLPMPQGQRRDEHGEEAVAAREFGQAVGEQGNAQGDQVVLDSAAGVFDVVEDQQAEPCLTSSPIASPAAIFHVTSMANHSSVHEPGAAPYRAIARARLVNGKARPSLSPASEVRLKRTSPCSGRAAGRPGRRRRAPGRNAAQHGAEQQGRRRCKAKARPAEQGDAGDRQRHGDRQQPPGGDPALANSPAG